MCCGQAANGRHCPRMPPKSTVHDDLELWNWDGTLERVHHVLYVAACEEAGREASPTAAIIDFQTAKVPKKGVLADPSGYDAGKKSKVQRRIVVDTIARAFVALCNTCHIVRQVLQ